MISWHPNFVTGGIVKRGEVLFTIESDNYEAAVLQAEAGLASARASLIEEQAKAEVAKRQAKNLATSKSPICTCVNLRCLARKRK